MRQEIALSVQVVHALDDFKALSEEWNKLLKKTHVDGIFLTWEWLYTWAKNYIGKNNLYIVLVYRESSLVGIAPLYISRRKIFRKLYVKELRFLASGEVCAAYLDFIALERERRFVIEVVYDYLCNKAKDVWDVLVLEGLSANSRSIEYLRRIIEDKGRVIDFGPGVVCPVINLPTKTDVFLETLGGSGRYNLNRKIKRLQKKGTVVHEKVSQAQGVEKAFNNLIQLHEKRWREKADGGSFQSATFAAFHHEIVSVFSQLGWVRFNFLTLNEEKIAGVYGYVYGGRYSFYLPGFDPEKCSESSPGTLLLFRCVEEAIAEELAVFDLLQGANPYKLSWSDGLNRLLTVSTYNRTFPAIALKIVIELKATIKLILR